LLVLCGNAAAQNSPWADPKPRPNIQSATNSFNPWTDPPPRPKTQPPINSNNSPQPDPEAGDIAPLNSLKQVKPKSVEEPKLPLRSISNPKPSKVKKEALRKNVVLEPMKIAPVPLQGDIEVENPSHNSIRIFGDAMNMLEYDYISKIHLGFAFSVVALDYRVITSKNTQGSLNTSDFTSAYVNLSSIQPAFGVSGLMDIHLNQFFSFRLQVGPILGSKDLTFWGIDSVFRNMRLESIIIEMPLLLKYKAMRTSNIRPYMITGITPCVNVAAMGKFNEEKGIYLAVNPYDIQFNIGIGGDFYLRNFKVGIELKYSTSFFNNIFKDALQGYEKYPASIERAISHSFALSILFDG
jgi:hypothetical protein